MLAYTGRRILSFGVRASECCADRGLWYTIAMTHLTRRSVLLGGIGAIARGQHLPRPNLLEVAAAYVRIAEASREGGRQLWGRIGGSPAEHQSARLFSEQLQPYLGDVRLERFEFRSHRPRRWTVRLNTGYQLGSAFPTPFNARFPDGVTTAPIALVTPDSGWESVRGRWAFLPKSGTTSFNSVRDKQLYERAISAGAAGLVFSIDTPPGRWQVVARIGKYWSIEDDRYPDRRRPIPCYAIDTDDANTVAEGIRGGASLNTALEYESTDRLHAFNTVGFLPGNGKASTATLIINHLDGFFAGANDNASGVATTVGLAARLAQITKNQRNTDFCFAGISAHHDAAAGTRAFVQADSRRFRRFGKVFLVEHTDAVDAPKDAEFGWERPLNNQRIVYLGSQGWPEIREAMPRLVRETGVMTVDPKMENTCAADLVAFCGELDTVTVLNTPPFYHTNYDTMDRISRRGMEAAVYLHMRLFEVTGCIEKGTAEASKR